MPKKVVPSGLRYSDCEATIEQIASNKSRQYKSISYLGPEDIKQEVRIKCWAILNSYDPKRSGANLGTFLSVCVDNRLRDIKRSLLFKYNKPCIKCPFYPGNDGCVRFSNKMDCNLYSRHEKYIQTKLSASHPVDIDNKLIYDKGSEDFIENLEFIDFIQTHLPSGVMGIFEELASVKFNFKKISARKRKIIKLHLWEIYTKFGQEENKMEIL